MSCKLVVAGCDTTPVLEAAEHALDEVALAIGQVVEGVEGLAGWIVRDDGDSPAPDEEAAQCIAIVSSIARQTGSRRNGADQGGSRPNVAAMASRHVDGDWTSESVNDGVDFRGAAPARATDRLRLRPPFPPAAERCAFAVVLSIA